MIDKIEEAKKKAYNAKLNRIEAEAMYTLIKVKEGSEDDIPTVRPDAQTKIKLVNYLKFG